MRVLVTGGAGYIGSHLVDLLLASNHEVTVIDNLSTGKIANLAHCIEDIRFINGSILDQPLIEREVERCQLVFHLAAAVGVRHIVDRPLESLLTNSRGTENVLEACFKYWRKVLVASTSEVYGKTAKVPMSEDDDRVLGSTKVHRWGYSTAKALDEHLAFAYAAHGLPVSVVRYFNSYGPRIDPRGYGSVVASFIGSALSGQPINVHGDGSQTRCFTYVDDTARGTFLAGFREEAEGTVVNLGNPVETSIRELAQEICTLVGSSSSLNFIPYEQYYGKGFEDTKRRVPDASRAKALLDWEPTVDLATGLARTLEWWKQTY
ncbi:MAG: GDP-mannose 4,6-dehydratase [Acidimicrobiales bacterium]|nr:GDP-mannose 4,6-dehydratase [Acidimicrobiales bacterium]